MMAARARVLHDQIEGTYLKILELKIDSLKYAGISTISSGFSSMI